jgi:hypothetical protein
MGGYPRPTTRRIALGQLRGVEAAVRAPYEALAKEWRAEAAGLRAAASRAEDRGDVEGHRILTSQAIDFESFAGMVEQAPGGGEGGR